MTSRKKSRGRAKTPKTKAFRVVARDSSGRFVKGRAATLTVIRPGKSPVTVKTKEQAARILMPSLGPYAQRREFDAVIRQVRGRVLKTSNLKNVTFRELLGPLAGGEVKGSRRAGGNRVLPPGLAKNKMITARVTVTRHTPDGAVISETVTIARAMRDELLPKIAGTLGFTDAEKSRLFAGPSGDTAANAYGVESGLSFRDRQGVLDRRGVARLSMQIEILG